MERQFDCFSRQAAQSAPFGVKSAPRKHLGLGTIGRGGICFDDDSVELDDPTGWVPLTELAAPDVNSTVIPLMALA